MSRRSHVFFVVCLLLALPLSGCGIETDRSEKPGADWSRGLRLGRTNLKQPVAIAVDARKHVHLVWCLNGLLYAHLDDRAHIVTSGPLDIDTPLPRQPQLLADARGNVHLAWLSRQGELQRLYHHVLVGPDKREDPILFSREGEDVKSFRMYLAPTGIVSFIWASRLADGSQGLMHATQEEPSGIVTITEPGIDPFILVDNTGTVHVAWLQERGLTSRTLYYATLQQGTAGSTLSPAGGHKLTDFEFAEGAVYFGPIIGLDTENVYVIWSEQNLGGGLTPTAAFSYYIAFKMGEPLTVNPTSIGLPTTSRPTYEGYQSPYGLTRLDPLTPADLRYSSDFVNSPASVSGQRGELVVAFSLMTESQAASEIQLATAILADRQQVGYQLASNTENASLMPSLVADADADLHLAWIDTSGFKEFEVYYASTAPQAKRWLDRTSQDDLAMGAAKVVFGVLSGIGLVPIAGIWSFPPMIWVVVFFIISGQEEMDRTPAKIGFAIAVLIYVGMKVLLLPGLFAGTPLLYLVPRGWTTFVGIAVPVAVLLLALGAVYIHVRRAQRPTIFKAFLIFALTDVLLTLVLYAPGFFGQA